MFGPPDRQADLSSFKAMRQRASPRGAEPQILAQARTHCRVASGQQPVGKKGVVVGEEVIDGTRARAVTGTVRLPRQADQAGMTFNSLRTLSWPNVGNSLEAPSRISGRRDAVRRIRRSRDGFGTAGATLRHTSRPVLWPPSDCRECSMRFPRVERLLIASVENLALGVHSVLVSCQWSGKTLARHRADRATVVRQALGEAGIVALESERLAADVLSADGKPRFVWTDTRPDPQVYARVILAPSPNGNAGKPSIKPPMLFKVPCRLWMVFRQPISHPDQPVPTTASPTTSQVLVSGLRSRVSAANPKDRAQRGP
jgi:hypothetical protein